MTITTMSGGVLPPGVERLPAEPDDHGGGLLGQGFAAALAGRPARVGCNLLSLCLRYQESHRPVGELPSHPGGDGEQREPRAEAGCGGGLERGREGEPRLPDRERGLVLDRDIRGAGVSPGAKAHRHGDARPSAAGQRCRATTRRTGFMARFAPAAAASPPACSTSRTAGPPSIPRTRAPRTQGSTPPEATRSFYGSGSRGEVGSRMQPSRGTKGHVIIHRRKSWARRSPWRGRHPYCRAPDRPATTFKPVHRLSRVRLMSPRTINLRTRLRWSRFFGREGGVPKEYLRLDRRTAAGPGCLDARVP